MSLFCNDVLLPSWGKLAVAEVLLVIWTQWSRKPSDREISVSVRERANGKRQQENEKGATVPGLRLKTDWEEEGEPSGHIRSPLFLGLLQRSCRCVAQLRAVCKDWFSALPHQGKQFYSPYSFPKSLFLSASLKLRGAEASWVTLRWWLWSPTSSSFAGTWCRGWPGTGETSQSSYQEGARWEYTGKVCWSSFY